jgi:hypothetical protein
MDSSIRRGLTCLTFERLFRKFKHSNSLGDLNKLFDYVIDVHTRARCKLTNGKKLLITTGLSSGNVFVSLLESIIMAALDHCVKAQIDSNVFGSGDCSTMGDDIISLLRLLHGNITQDHINYIFESYSIMATALDLTFHDLASKGFISSDISVFQFCSRRYLSYRMSVRDVDDTIGALISPEHLTSSYPHLLLRLVGLLFDNPISSVTEIILHMIQSVRQLIMIKGLDGVDESIISSMFRREGTHVYGVQLAIQILGEERCFQAMYSMSPNDLLSLMIDSHIGSSGTWNRGSNFTQGLRPVFGRSTYFPSSVTNAAVSILIDRLSILGVRISTSELFSDIEYIPHSAICLDESVIDTLAIQDPD